jgi:hypothetical protein
MMRPVSFLVRRYPPGMKIPTTLSQRSTRVASAPLTRFLICLLARHTGDNLLAARELAGS